MQPQTLEQMNVRKSHGNLEDNGRQGSEERGRRGSQGETRGTAAPFTMIMLQQQTSHKNVTASRRPSVQTADQGTAEPRSSTEVSTFHFKARG